jgi:hypothetical protein
MIWIQGEGRCWVLRRRLKWMNEVQCSIVPFWLIFIFFQLNFNKLPLHLHEEMP